MNWTAIGVIFGILISVVNGLFILWVMNKKGTRDQAQLENQVNLLFKMNGDQNKKIGAYFKKLDIARRQLDVLWAVFEERTGRMPIEKDRIAEDELKENGNE